MTKEKLFLLDALKSFIHEEKLNLDAELDQNELQSLAQIHSVTGILGYVVTQGAAERTAQIADRLKKQSSASAAVFSYRSNNAEKLFRKLNESGIDYMLFKGYVVRNYYPVPELRSYGDIDVLIKPEDRKKCHELMLKQGFEVKDDWEPVYSYYNSLEVYEFHTEVMEVDVSEKADYRAFFNTAWEHKKKVGEYSYEPTPEFHFLYLLTHIAKHIRGSGAGIRMYLDIAAFVKHFGDNIDWQYIDSKLDELKLKELANMALTISEKCFGVPSPIELHEIKEETFENFLDYTMDGGLFGHVGRDGGLVALKQAGDVSRSGTLMRKMFPPAKTIERRYTYLQGRHWLLPIAWVHRVFKNRDLWKQRAAEVRSIIQTDDAEVKKLRRIYKEIGL